MRRLVVLFALSAVPRLAAGDPPRPEPVAEPPPATPPTSPPPVPPKVGGAKVVAAIAAQAVAVAALPADLRPAGDALADRYVRAAAEAAGDDVRAFATGLAWAFDDGDSLATSPFAAAFRDLETTEERAARRKAMGSPTLRGRADLLKHFTVSAALAVLLSPDVAIGVGVAKEVSDARGGSGFSFADLLADMAGIDWMRRVRESAAASPLAEVAASFSGTGWMPDPAGEPEGLSAEAFEREYGSASDPRFVRKRGELAARIAALAAKRPATPRPRRGG